MHAEWNRTAISLSDNIAWLDAYDPTPTGPPRVRTLTELTERRAELDTILASAPADQRHVITALANGQLTLDDAAGAIIDALGGQGDRQRWVLEHWPHIVEALQVDTSLGDTATDVEDNRVEMQILDR